MFLIFLISAIIQIETGGKNINGDGNKSIGLMQVRVENENLQKETDLSVNIKGLQCLTCVEKHKNKILTEQNHQKDLHNAKLKDKLEFTNDQAETFAKSLKNIYDKLENIIDDLKNAEDGICLSDLTKLKNSIPESALRRAK